MPNDLHTWTQRPKMASSSPILPRHQTTLASIGWNWEPKSSPEVTWPLRQSQCFSLTD